MFKGGSLREGLADLAVLEKQLTLFLLALQNTGHRDKRASLTVSTVSAVMTVLVMTTTPLKLNLLFQHPESFSSETATSVLSPSEHSVATLLQTSVATIILHHFHPPTHLHLYAFSPKVMRGLFRHRPPRTPPSYPPRPESIGHQSKVKSGNQCRINVESMPNRPLRREGRSGFEGGVRGSVPHKPLTTPKSVFAVVPQRGQKQDPGKQPT